jgi:sialic acid synthase SpsE
MKIIAEVGSNVKSVTDALASVDGAKACGANIVKFQLIEPGDLLTAPDKQVLKREWLPIIDDYCRFKEIEFACSAFCIDAYLFIDRFVKRHKIASCEISDPEILSMVNGLGKPVIISTGCARPTFIRDFVLPKLKNVQVTIMICVSDYPAQIIDFTHFEEFRAICGNHYTYGFSDHSTDALVIPRKAQFHGASIIEKHVNFIPGMESDDVGHSLTERAFKLMVRALRDEPIDPEETWSMSTMEGHLRRPIALCDIKAGDEIVLGQNVRYHRHAGKGFPIDLTRMVYHANQKILKGELINDHNVQ